MGSNWKCVILAKIFILCPCFHIFKMKISVTTIQILGNIKHNLCNSRMFVTWKVLNKYNHLKFGDLEPMVVTAFPKGWNSRDLSVCVCLVGSSHTQCKSVHATERICEPVIVTNHRGIKFQLSLCSGMNLHQGVLELHLIFLRVRWHGSGTFFDSWNLLKSTLYSFSGDICMSLFKF